MNTPVCTWETALNRASAVVYGVTARDPYPAYTHNSGREAYMPWQFLCNEEATLATRPASEHDPQSQPLRFLFLCGEETCTDNRQE